MAKGWTSDDTFSFWMPAKAILSKGSAGEKEDKRWIQGIASTAARDLQGEIVDQNGIDFSYFMKHGYFNNDHKPGFKNKVGQPTECCVTSNGLWVKGFLFKNHEVADDIWELLNSLDRSESDRRLGFSIQGKVKRRNGKEITECWIQDIAVTPAPVNTTTWAEIAKSLSSCSWDLKKDEEDEETEEKALTAGGSVLVPESLEGKVKKDYTSKSLSFSETVEYVRETTGVSTDAAEATARVIFGVFGL